MNPSGSGKTPRHDNLQLAFCEEGNLIWLVRWQHTFDHKEIEFKGRTHYYFTKDDWEHYMIDADIIDIKREHPLYNNKYLLGVCDLIITYDLKYYTFNVKTDESKQYSLRYKLLVEFKPTIESACGTIDQTKIYANHLESTAFCRANGTLRIVVVTYDTRKKYDKLFNAENINVIRIPE